MGESVGPRSYSQQKEDKKDGEASRVRELLEASKNRDNMLNKAKTLNALLDEE
jgi:hypothetical protein